MRYVCTITSLLLLLCGPLGAQWNPSGTPTDSTDIISGFEVGVTRPGERLDLSYSDADTSLADSSYATAFGAQRSHVDTSAADTSSATALSAARAWLTSLFVGGVEVTSSAADLNKLDGAGATVTATALDSLTDGSNADALHTHGVGAISSFRDSAAAAARDTVEGGSFSLSGGWDFLGQLLFRADSTTLARRDTTIASLGASMLYPFNLHSIADQAALVRDGDGWRYVNDIDQFRADELTNGSGVTMPGAGWLTITPGDSLVVLDATTRDTTWVAAPVAGGLLSSATPALTDVLWKDGQIYVTGLDTVGLTRIDLRTGTVEKWLGSGHYAWNGSLNAPNTASGWVKLSTTPVLNDDRVNSVDVSRNPYPEVNAQHYITVGTLKGITQFVYDGDGDVTLWDARQTNPVRDVDVLADGEIIHLGQPQGQSSWTNGTSTWAFETFVSSGTNLLSLINSSGTGTAHYQVPFVDGTRYRFTYYVAELSGPEQLYFQNSSTADLASTGRTFVNTITGTGWHTKEYTADFTDTRYVGFKANSTTITAKILHCTYSTSADSVHWYQAGSSFTADSRATDGTWSAGGSGSEWIPFDSTATFRSIAGVEGGSPAGERCPMVWVGSDSGLVGLGARASDTQAGGREVITADYTTLPLYGGPTVVFSGYSSANHGSDTGIFTKVSDVTYVVDATAPTGAYALFGNTDDYLWYPDGPAVEPGAAFTAGGWAYILDMTDSNVIIAKWDLGVDGWELYADTNGDVWSFKIEDSSGNVTLSSGVSVEENTWYYVVGTYDGVTMRIYVNGVECATSSGTVSGSLDDKAHQLRVGSEADAYHEMDGRISGAFFAQSVAPSEWVKNSYTRALSRMATPTSDLLTGTGAPLQMRVNPYNDMLYLAYTDGIEIRDGTSGALLASRDSTTLDIGAVATVGWDPAAHPDSFSVVAGGATGVYVETTSDRLTDLADYVWPDRGGPVYGTAVRADSSGAGHTWKVQTALDMAYNVGRRFVDVVGPYIYPDPVTSMLANGMQLRGVGGRPTITNANSTGVPAINATGDSIDVFDVLAYTAPSGAGGNQNAVTSAGVRNRFWRCEVLHSDYMGIDINGADNELHDCVVHDSDAYALSADASRLQVEGGSYTATVGAYGMTTLASSVPRFRARGTTFYGVTKALVLSAEQDSSAIIGCTLRGDVGVTSLNVKSILLGNTVIGGTITDLGTDTQCIANVSD